MAAKKKPGVVKQPGNNTGGATGKGFKPGQSGNPKGRPPNEFSLTALLREAVQKKTVAGVEIPEGKTAAQAIVDRAIEAAISGNFQYFKEIIERIDGKVVDLSAIEQRQIVVIRRDRHPGEPAPDAGEGPA